LQSPEPQSDRIPQDFLDDDTISLKEKKQVAEEKRLKIFDQSKFKLMQKKIVKRKRRNKLSVQSRRRNRN